ncbi:hypothetical protein F8388_021674 [Cannabis sativa]|uniref:Multidrug and toxic compound extrusion protein n=1 Tax=Cannabis sativa TaxID=3483 RepID=A0A7J6DXT9_CANSA|nr:hypothetical protein F8388_021674 [Cannabis sativa]
MGESLIWKQEDEDNLEKGLLENEKREEKVEFFRDFIKELKLLGYIAGPMFGMSGALETLSGQAYGAKQYRKLGTQTNTAILCLILVCIPLSLIWFYMENILIVIGQNPNISRQAGQFLLWLIPALFAYATLQPLIRYFQSQSLIKPLLVSSCVSISCHVPLCWTLVFKCGLQHCGAAISIGISYWLNVILLLLYMTFSSTCESTRVPISSELFQGCGEFFRLAIPSAAMSCMSTISTLYTIPEGLGSAGSTRVSNELGAGKPRAARLAVGAVMFLSVSESIIVSSALFAGRKAFGYFFTNDKEVVDYAMNMAPLVCLSVIFDSLHATLSGIARGCGWQDLGAYVNLGAYYLVGIPVAAALGFRFDLRGKGLWIGIIIGSFLQAFLLSLIAICTNWNEKAKMARKRMFEEIFEESTTSLV